METTDLRPSGQKLDTQERTPDGFAIHKHDRFWQVTDPNGQLVCITVYKRGAKEVVRRLSG